MAYCGLDISVYTAVVCKMAGVGSGVVKCELPANTGSESSQTWPGLPGGTRW
jgi:hypothetical protein